MEGIVCRPVTQSQFNKCFIRAVTKHSKCLLYNNTLNQDGTLHIMKYIEPKMTNSLELANRMQLNEHIIDFNVILIQAYVAHLSFAVISVFTSNYFILYLFVTIAKKLATLYL
jgi:hypothetical protein